MLETNDNRLARDRAGFRVFRGC